MLKFSKFIPQTFLLLILLFISQGSSAQVYVASDGDVGVGTTSPSAKLDVYNSGASQTRGIENRNYYSGASSKYGLYNYTTNGTGARYGIANWTYGTSGSSSSHYGLYNYNLTYANSAYGTYNYMFANGGSGTKYGLYTRLFCSNGDGTGGRYGLYASVGCTGGYAGYFAGNVYVSGTITSTSDASKKTNITDLSGALGVISQLKPKTYDYKLEDDLHLPSEKQYGFLAQELEEVLPELVKDVETMIEFDEVDEEGHVKTPEVSGTIKTVNYIALIPILVEGMQEQQKLIEAQAEEIRLLKAEIKH